MLHPSGTVSKQNTHTNRQQICFPLARSLDVEKLVSHSACLATTAHVARCTRLGLAATQPGNVRAAVVSVLLQPRSSIFELFDDLLLLSEGCAVYSGPAAGAVDYFAALGHPCPERYNPAEFLADLISVDTASPDAEQSTR